MRNFILSTLIILPLTFCGGCFKISFKNSDVIKSNYKEKSRKSHNKRDSDDLYVRKENEDGHLKHIHVINGDNTRCLQCGQDVCRCP